MSVPVLTGPALRCFRISTPPPQRTTTYLHANTKKDMDDWSDQRRRSPGRRRRRLTRQSAHLPGICVRCASP